MNELKRRNLLGLLDAGATVGSSIVAEPAAGVAGLFALGSGAGLDKSRQAMEGMRELLSYVPRTEQGRQYLESMAYNLEPVMEHAAAIGQRGGEAAYQLTGSPGLATAIQSAPTLFAELVGVKGLGGLRNVDIGDVSRMGVPRNELGAIAYHGSPHDFPPVKLLEMPDGTKVYQNMLERKDIPEGAKVLEDYPMGRFDISKIGTGEGAQVYGHGLYFAENPDVAKGYQKTLANIDPQKKGYLTAHANAQQWVDKFGGDEQYTIDALSTYAEANPEMQKTIDMIKSGEYKKPINEGRLYTVDIPDEAIDKMLDWDKPLSEQPKAVQDALRGIDVSGAIDANGLDIGGAVIRRNDGQYSNKSSPWVLESGDSVFGLSDADVNRMVGGSSNLSNMTAEQLYTRLSKQLGSPAAASAKLQEIGIPGIRYLDQGSRAEGKGTRNFVVFDDKLIKVKGKE